MSAASDESLITHTKLFNRNERRNQEVSGLLKG